MFFRETHFEMTPIRSIKETCVLIFAALAEIAPVKPQVTILGDGAASAAKVRFSEKHEATRYHLGNRLTSTVESAFCWRQNKLTGDGENVPDRVDVRGLVRLVG